MSIIRFEDGTRVKFEGTPTQKDVEEVAQQLKLKKTTLPPQPTPQSSIPGTFPSNPVGSPLGEAAKTVANIPGSAVNFAVKGVGGTLNPLNTLKTGQNLAQSVQGARQEAQVDPRGKNAILKDTITGLPNAAYHSLVPSFIQHLIKGNTEEAARNITEDPVGQIAPLILMGKAAAEKAGVGPQFDAAISKTAKTATAPFRAAGNAVTKVAGKVASETLGVTTGAGGEAVRQAYNATPEFTEALRGRTPESAIVDKAQSALENIRETRRVNYRTQLENLKGDETIIDFKPIENKLHTNLKNYGVKVADDGTLDFSRSVIGNAPEAVRVIESAYKDIIDWGKQQGDTTPAGLDILKKRLDDLYAPTGQSRSFVQSLKETVTQRLNEVPGYEDMTRGYADMTKLINDIKSGTGAGGKASADTVIKKLNSALKQNQDFRLEMVKELEKHSGQNLLQELSGSSLSSAIPRGLFGKGLDLLGLSLLLRGFIEPSVFIELASSSPRLVGEFVRALGLSARKTKALLNQINNVQIPTPAAISPNKQQP